MFFCSPVGRLYDGRCGFRETTRHDCHQMLQGIMSKVHTTLCESQAKQPQSLSGNIKRDLFFVWCWVFAGVCVCVTPSTCPPWSNKIVILVGAHRSQRFCSPPCCLVYGASSNKPPGRKAIVSQVAQTVGTFRFTHPPTSAISLIDGPCL